MGGGLLELVAHGVQDIYLIGNPQITFFKIVYKRHTNFSMESIRATHNGTADYGQTITYELPRSGDLIHTMILEIDIPAITGSNTPKYVNGFGHAVIDYVDLEIGGQSIDKHYGEWMEIWTQLSYSHSKQEAYDILLPRSDIDTTVAGHTAIKTVYIPLQFWFCRNIGLALPLIALQYHEVSLKIKFQPFSKIFTFGKKDTLLPTGDITDITSDKTITDVRLYIDYIYLDTYERKKFAQMKHRYLIEQLQKTEEIVEASATSKRIDLNFNHPIKSLYWVSQVNSVSDNNDNFNFSKSLDRATPSTMYLPPLTHAVIKLNGIERFDKRQEAYFRLIQPFLRHTRVSKLHIYMYSFALNPEEHQPSGTCNFSRLDNAHLSFNELNDPTNHNINVYALNYNVLRIMSGMGGLAYSN